MSPLPRWFLAASLLLGSMGAAADVPIPPIPVAHPRILSLELQRFRNDLAAQRPAIVRFKQQVVDAQLAGGDIYGYEPWFSAFMGVVSQDPRYCAHAIQTTDAFLDQEAALIRAGEAPVAREDSYLFIGEAVGGVALVYDWCYPALNDVQKLRWGNYADRFTDNVWNQATNHWGAAGPENNYSWEGVPQPAGSGWSVDNPVNNYYYSFLRATMLWGIASKGEPGRVKADGFLNKFRNEKIQNQLVPVFNAQVPGGGSREGTGYGTAMRGLFDLYFLWERTTAERIADLTPHTRNTMLYLLNVIAPTKDKLAPIGDLARDSTATFYDYHRAELLAPSTLFRGTAAARTVRDFLAVSALPRMHDGFNFIEDVFYDNAETAAPATLGTSYYAHGTGHFFTRSDWSSSATWLTFLTGAFTESHAHEDGLSILLYRNGWLVNDANMESHSGLRADQESHGLVTMRIPGGATIPMYSYGAEDGHPESSVKLNALAVKPTYTYASADSGTLFVHPSQGDQGVRLSRDVVTLLPGVVIVLDRAHDTRATVTKTFQLPVPGVPTIQGRTASYDNGVSRLTVHAVSPVDSVLGITDMRTVDPQDFEGGYRIDASVTSNTPTLFLHVLSIDGAVASVVRGANDAAATLTLADGRRVVVQFNAQGAGGTIDIRNAGGGVLVSEALPTTVLEPGVYQTATALVSSRATAAAGSPIVFTATVTAPDGSQPTGRVGFRMDGVLVGACANVALAGGMAQCTTSIANPGVHTVAAEYGGEGLFSPSSASIGQTVKPRALVALDLNGDARSDLLWQKADGSLASWLMSGTNQIGGRSLFGPATGWTFRTAADFNGDGRHDLLFEHTDGRVAMWLMNGDTQIGGAVLLPAASGWHVVLVADFDGDGRADIVWQHTDGRVALWLMNGATQVGGGVLLAAASGWTPKATGDFNGDGRADLLWEHTDGRTALWLLNGVQQVGGSVLLAAGTGWKVKLVADFDADSRADIVWEHADGRSALWLMNGASQAGGRQLFGAGTGWTAKLVGDLDGDAKADILFEHTDGRVAAWLMDGITQVGGALLIEAGTGWVLSAARDFDGDGRFDLLWQHADGRAGIWIMAGTTALSGIRILGAGTGWNVVTTP